VRVTNYIRGIVDSGIGYGGRYWVERLWHSAPHKPRPVAIATILLLYRLLGHGWATDVVTTDH